MVDAPSIAKMNRPELIREDDRNHTPVPTAQIATEPLDFRSKKYSTRVSSTSVSTSAATSSQSHVASSSSLLVDQSLPIAIPTVQDVKILITSSAPRSIRSPTVVVQTERSTLPYYRQLPLMNLYMIPFLFDPSGTKSARDMLLCFSNHNDFVSAIDQYVNETCELDSKCVVGKKYG
eukprot:CCRYP_019444-RA/>CCRYP_019444-RA protein AED:0.87 eAED:0.87 QI:0/0/0/0.5/1/1/2/0/176